jgi:hypothetical protein
MKRKTSLALVILLLIGILTGCSSASRSSYDTFVESNTSSSDYYDVSTTESSNVFVGASEDGGVFSDEVSLTENADFSEKMIYTASAEIETTEFDKSVEAVYDLIDNYSAFLESSYVTGNDYRTQFYGYQSYRYAEFVIRVPSSGYSSLTKNLSVLGNVLSVNEQAENITEQYYDVQSRLDTYNIEEERLLSMLEKADNVSDMIEIESRISDVRYQIESLETKLRNWQNQVDYSTVTITLEEVRELTETVEVQRTYWQQIGDGLKKSTKSVGKFFKNLFKDFVIALPILLTIAVIAVILILIIVKIIIPLRQRRKEKRREKTEKAENKDTDKENKE